MRTTVDLDDDVAVAVKERARREGRSAGKVLSELARQALLSTASAAPPGEPFHGFRPFPRRGIVVSSELINKIREEEGV